MIGQMILRRMSSLAQPIARPGSGHYKVPNNPKYKKLMERQLKYCRDDGLLVWQKENSDMGLYYLSVGLVAVGTLLTFETLRRLASPPKND